MVPEAVNPANQYIKEEFPARTVLKEQSAAHSTRDSVPFKVSVTSAFIKLIITILLILYHTVNVSRQYTKNK